MRLPPEVVAPYERQLGPWRRELVEARVELWHRRPTAISTATPLPAVLWIPGGGWGWRGPRQAGRDQVCVPLAARGYVVAGVNYRTSTEARFPAQLDDCMAAIGWLRAHAGELAIDPSRLGVWGRSAGGHLAALVGTAGATWRAPGNDEAVGGVQAVVDCFGPTDLAQILVAAGGSPALRSDREAHVRRLCRELFGGEIEEHPQLVQRANPLAHVRGVPPPFLMVHGANDATIPLRQAEVLHAALRAAGGQSELLAVANAGHGLLPEPAGALVVPDLPAIHERIWRFFDRHPWGGSAPLAASL